MGPQCAGHLRTTRRHAPELGYCELSLANVAYQVTFECTGIFALFMCVASVLAFPTTVSRRVKGLLLVVPAFACYSTMRLVILGLVAHFTPQHIHLVHLYVMVLVNIGFVLTLWLYWVREVAIVRPSR